MIQMGGCLCRSCSSGTRKNTRIIIYLYNFTEVLLLTFCVNILDFVSFCSGSSRSAAHLKLQLSPANRSTNRIRHFYFSRLPRLWNYLPTINLEKSVMSIKSDITAFFWSRFQQTFDPSRPCTYHAVCPCARCSSLSLPNNFNLAVSTY